MATLSASNKKPDRKYTTPQILKGSLYLSCAASLFLIVTSLSSMQQQRTALKTLGKDAAPSIMNALRIRDSLADADANAVNELVAPLGQGEQAFKAYTDRRAKLAMLMVNMAENITYDEEERQPIRTLQFELGNYIAKIQQARDARLRGSQADTLVAYREAMTLMDKTLLPTAETLSQVNLNYLNGGYNQDRQTALLSVGLLWLSGLALLSTLVWLQVFLSRRTKRTLNLALLTATAIAVLFISHTTQALTSAGQQLKVAKEDAFMSLYNLRSARSLAYGANADESRYLLDAAMAPQHEQAFWNKVNQIAKLPAGQSYTTIANAALQGQTTPGFAGYFANQLNNITFPGELTASVQTLSAWDRYLQIDRQIRQLKQSGNLAAATALCIGYNTGQSNWAFEQFKDAHQKVLDINQQAFDNALQEGLNAVGWQLNANQSNPSSTDSILISPGSYTISNTYQYEILATGAVAAIVGLTFLGLRPRLKEYSA